MFHSKRCSMILRIVKIWSFHSFRKPACSSLTKYIAWDRQFSNSSTVVTATFSVSFFSILTIKPFDQSGGILSFSQMFLKGPWNTLLEVLMIYFSRSAIMASNLVALLFLNDLMAFCTSFNAVDLYLYQCLQPFV